MIGIFLVDGTLENFGPKVNMVLPSSGRTKLIRFFIDKSLNFRESTLAVRNPSNLFFIVGLTL